MVFQQLLESLKKNEDSCLITIVKSSGSTPRKNGTKMLVNSKGRITGTVGGGPIEYECEQFAMQLIQEKKDASRSYNLVPENQGGVGAVCGGKMEVVFHYLSHENKVLAEICRHLIEQKENHQSALLWTPLTLNPADPLVFYSKKTGWVGTEGQQPLTDERIKKTGRYEVASGEYLVENLGKDGKVIVFGGGHVAQSLVPILNYLDFYVVVVDDRPEYLTEDVFPLANERIVADLSDISQKVVVKPNDYTMVMTRGHEFDEDILRQLLVIDPYYIGVMGSKHKVAMIKRMLNKEGFDPLALDNVCMPIGIDIKAETPAELAISLSAELIEKRASAN